MVDERILNRLADRLATALAPPCVPLWRFVVDGCTVGELEAARVERLRGWPQRFAVEGEAIGFAPGIDDFASRSEAMDDTARALAAEGRLTAWRGERYAVAERWGAPPLFTVERAAARFFGVATYAVHVNGTAPLANGSPGMWIARRSPGKAIDPGLLDNLVGGGIAFGADVRGTLAKEAWEEAGLSAAIAGRACAAGEVRIHRVQPDGVQRETIFAHDLDLTAAIAPANRDGEVVEFRLVPVDAATTYAGSVEGPDVMTADAALVVADWLLRHGHAPAGSPAARRLDALRRAPARSSA